MESETMEAVVSEEETMEAVVERLLGGLMRVQGPLTTAYNRRLVRAALEQGVAVVLRGRVHGMVRDAVGEGGSE